MSQDFAKGIFLGELGLQRETEASLAFYAGWLTGSSILGISTLAGLRDLAVTETHQCPDASCVATSLTGDALDLVGVIPFGAGLTTTGKIINKVQDAARTLPSHAAIREVPDADIIVKYMAQSDNPARGVWGMRDVKFRGTLIEQHFSLTTAESLGWFNLNRLRYNFKGADFYVYLGNHRHAVFQQKSFDTTSKTYTNSQGLLLLNKVQERMTTFIGRAGRVQATDLKGIERFSGGPAVTSSSRLEPAGLAMHIPPDATTQHKQVMIAAANSYPANPVRVYQENLDGTRTLLHRNEADKNLLKETTSGGA